MDELRRALDRERRRFSPEPGGYGRLAARRRRRRLTRQAGSAFVALLLAGAGTWIAVRAFSQFERPGHEPRPAGQPINVRNVNGLRLAWTGSKLAEDDWSIRVTSGEVLLNAPHELLTAFPSSCSARSCGVAWQASGVESGKPTSPLPVVGDNVFAVSNSLAAYPLSCGEHGTLCDPAWTAEAHPAPASMTTPTVSNGRLYVGTSDGRVLAFGTTCPSASHTCRPLWSTRVTSDPIRFAPAVNGDDVYVVADRLFDIPASCQAIEPCTPRWTAPVGPFVNPPVARAGWVYMSEGDRLLAFRASCGRDGEPCSPAWTFEPQDGSLLSQPAVGNGMVYVTGARLYALPVDCGGRGASCSPVWTGGVSASSWKTQPALGNGLVFTVASNRIVAFGAGCRSGGLACLPAWSSTTLEPGLSAPGVGQDAVFVVGRSGTLYAFEVPRASAPGSG